MRRTIRYTAGLMIAAGAGLAFAGPAAAAPAGPCIGLSCYTSNYQYLGQSAWTNQTTLNNVGNPQIGLGNYNGGGSASSNSYTGQYGGIFGAW